jgi:beta-lactamase regulating signal transducer with metallopeptidase domain
VTASRLVWEAALRGALLFAVAALLVWRLRNRSAASRHRAWTAAMLGQLVLPLFAQAPFAWHLPVPEAGLRLSTAGALHMAGSGSGKPDSSGSRDQVASSTTAGRGVSDFVTRLPRLFGALWLCGACLGAARLGLGTLRLWRAALTARRIEDGAWLSLAQQVACGLGIARPVTLAAGLPRRVPLTWGVIYPRIVLPAEALDWTEERRRLVLVHELAHVKRLDALTQLIGQIAITIYWFSPFVWLAARRMHAEHERACDEAVVRSGAVPSRYAEELLEIRRMLDLGAQPAFGALAAFRPSGFEQRLCALLRPGPRPLPDGRVSSAVLAAWGLPVALALAVVHPAADPSHRVNHGADDRSCTVRESGVVDVTLRVPGPQEVGNVGATSGAKTVLAVFDGNACLTAVLSGTATLTADLDDVVELSRDGSLSLFDSRRPTGPRADVAERDGRILRRYRDGGTERPWSEGKQWFAEAMGRVVRDNGYDAGRRVDALMRRGGVTAVLEEAQRSRSEPGRYRVMAALVERGPLAGAEREQVIRTVRTLQSTVERETLLHALARHRGPS